MKFLLSLILGSAIAGCGGPAPQSDAVDEGDDAALAPLDEQPDECSPTQMSDLPGVSLQLDLPACRFTLDQMHEGVAADYVLTIADAIPSVTSNKGCYTEPPASLFVTWFIASDTTMGCGASEDDDLCDPEHEVARWVDLDVSGSTSQRFVLRGSSLPSLCTHADLPGGVPGLDPSLMLADIEPVDPFEPGQYVVSVVARGMRRVDDIEIPFHVSASRTIEVIE